MTLELWPEPLWVVDNLTGQLANEEKIALTEPWADRIIRCNTDGFLEQDGGLLFLDSCGNYAPCPKGRFTVVPPTDRRAIWRKFWGTIRFEARMRLYNSKDMDAIKKQHDREWGPDDE